MPETHARRALCGRELSFTVLAPLGSWLGRGTLRVLRVREADGALELITGYESYERLES